MEVEGICSCTDCKIKGVNRKAHKHRSSHVPDGTISDVIRLGTR